MSSRSHSSRSSPTPGNASALPFFVYGTLRPGQANYQRFLAGKTTQELPATLPDHSMYAQIYPYVADAPGGGTVTGDLLFIAPTAYLELLELLDRLEGYRPGDPTSAYVRVVRAAHYREPTGRSRSADAWVYQAGPRLRASFGEWQRVPGGDWLAHLQARG